MCDYAAAQFNTKNLINTFRIIILIKQLKCWILHGDLVGVAVIKFSDTMYFNQYTKLLSELPKYYLIIYGLGLVVKN